MAIWGLLGLLRNAMRWPALGVVCLLSPTLVRGQLISTAYNGALAVTTVHIANHVAPAKLDRATLQQKGSS